jgi:hypothetical protein
MPARLLFLCVVLGAAVEAHAKEREGVDPRSAIMGELPAANACVSNCASVGNNFTCRNGLTVPSSSRYDEVGCPQELQSVLVLSCP